MLFAPKEALERRLAHLKKDWVALVVVAKGNGCLGECGNHKITVNPVLVVDKYQC